MGSNLMNFDITGIKLDEICTPNPFLTLPGAQNGLPDQFKTILKSYQKSYFIIYFPADYCVPFVQAAVEAASAIQHLGGTWRISDSESRA